MVHSVSGCMLGENNIILGHIRVYGARGRVNEKQWLDELAEIPPGQLVRFC